MAPHVIRRLLDTRTIFEAEDPGNYDVAYTAGKALRIGERDIALGEPCPEVAEFEPRTLKRLIENQYVVATRTLREEPHGQPTHQRHHSRARLSA